MILLASNSMDEKRLMSFSGRVKAVGSFPARLLPGGKK